MPRSDSGYRYHPRKKVSKDGPSSKHNHDHHDHKVEPSEAAGNTSNVFAHGHHHRHHKHTKVDEYGNNTEHATHGKHMNNDKPYNTSRAYGSMREHLVDTSMTSGNDHKGTAHGVNHMQHHHENSHEHHMMHNGHVNIESATSVTNNSNNAMDYFMNVNHVHTHHTNYSHDVKHVHVNHVLDEHSVNATGIHEHGHHVHGHHMHDQPGHHMHHEYGHLEHGDHVHEHQGHDHHSMTMYFHTNTSFDFLLEGLSISSIQGIILAMLFAMAITMFFEAVNIKLYLRERQLAQQTSKRQMTAWNLRYRIVSSVFKSLSSALAYIAMLCAMTMNIWLLVSVTLGSGLGHLFIRPLIETTFPGDYDVDNVVLLKGRQDNYECEIPRNVTPDRDTKEQIRKEMVTEEEFEKLLGDNLNETKC